MLDLSIIAFLFNTDRLARDRSAVTRVIEILPGNHKPTVVLGPKQTEEFTPNQHLCTYLPSNLCFRKSNNAFCIISVTCTTGHCEKHTSEKHCEMNQENLGHEVLIVITFNQSFCGIKGKIKESSARDLKEELYIMWFGDVVLFRHRSEK